VLKDQLTDWITHCASSVPEFKYQFFSKDAGIDHSKLVPVPFPSDVDLILEFHSANPIKISNPRSTEPMVLHADQLLDDNISPDVHRDVLHSMPDGRSFPVGYNGSLLDLLIHLPTADPPRPDPVQDLTDMLRLGFWGGTRWNVRRTAVNDLSPSNIMFLETTSAVQWTTNLHSLVGLMFNVGTQADLANLKTVAGFDMTLVVDGTAQPIPVPQWANDSVKAFFASLKDPLPPSDVTLAATDRNKVVFVRQNLVSFNYMTLGSQTCFRRRRDDASLDSLLSLRKLTRVSARWLKPTNSGRADLTCQFYSSFEVQLTPYRDVRTPPKGSTSSTLLQLKPVHSIEEEFFGAVAARTSWWDDALLFSASGPIVAKPLAVGEFYFPWDDPIGSPTRRRTLLFYGKIPSDPSVTLFLPCKDSAGQIIQATVTQLNEILIDERRWEWVPPGPLPDIEFDAVFVDPSTSVSLPDLKVGLSFDGDTSFDLAESVSNIGIVLDASYPTPPSPGKPTDVTAQNELLHDLVNYNALNLSSKWGSVEEGWLNPYSEIYPIAKGTDPTTGRIVQHFEHQRGRPALAPPDSKLGDVLPSDPRLFFDLVYSHAGQPRLIAANLEHTYGVELSNPASVTLDTWLDFPPTLPGDILFIDSHGNKFPFVYLEFDFNNYDVVLVFNLDFLAPSWEAVDPPNRGPVRAAAWRSVAEMAHADALNLRGTFLTYNFRTLLKSGDQTKLINAFERVSDLDNWSIVLTQLRTACSNWLQQPVPTGNRVTISLKLTGFPDIRQVCDVFEFEIEVFRSAKCVPAEAVDWTFMEAQGLFGESASKFVQVATPPTAQFEVWRKSLLSRRQAVRPDWNDGSPNPIADATSKFHRLVGDSTPESMEAHGAWIAIPPSLSKDTAAITVCPVSFLPVKIDETLKKATFPLLKQYFRAMEIVCSCAVMEGRNFDITAWQHYLSLLQVAISDLSLIQKQALNLIQVLPNAANPRLNPELKDLIAHWPDWRGAFIDWLGQHLWSTPSLFGSARAFSLSRVQDPNGAIVTRDVFRLLSEKILQPQSPSDPTKLDLDRVTVRDSLSSLADGTLFGFPEILDDLRFGNSFCFSRLALCTFDALLGSVLENPLDDDVTDIVTKRWVFPKGQQTPPGPQILPGPSTPPPPPPISSPTIYLASREPLWPPVHVFTGVIKEAQKYHDMDVFDPALNGGRELDGQNFRHGILTLLDFPEKGVKMVARGTTGQRSGRLDTCMISVLLTISGDEGPFPDNYGLDDFFILIKEAPPGIQVRDFSTALPWGTRFVELEKAADPAAIPNLADIVLDRATLLKMPDALQNAVDPTHTPVSELLSKPYISIAKDSQTGNPILKFGNTGGANFDAFLFRTSSSTVAQDFLLISVQVPVWNRWNVAIVQSRNVSATQEPDQDFDPRFGETSDPISDDKPCQADLASTVDLPVFTTLPRSCSLETLVSEVLKPTLISQGDDWKSVPLSVDVFHEQALSFEGSWQSGSDVEFVPNRNQFAVKNYRFNPNTPSEYTQTNNWFPSEYDDFRVDFQWFSSRNTNLLRISRIRVHVV
jgi:hypothetical protein